MFSLFTNSDRLLCARCDVLERVLVKSRVDRKWLGVESNRAKEQQEQAFLISCLPDKNACWTHCEYLSSMRTKVENPDKNYVYINI